MSEGQFEHLDGSDTLDKIQWEATAALERGRQLHQYEISSAGNRLKVFVGSKMGELRDVRTVISDALRIRGFEAFLYEDTAGARPETVIATSLQEVEKADVYVGLFGREYGDVTIQEYRHARGLRRPCFIYIRDRNQPRDPELEKFLGAEIYDPANGVTYAYFDDVLQLSKDIVSDIWQWLIRHHRAYVAQARVTEDSFRTIEQLTQRVRSSPPELISEIIHE